MWPGLDDAVVIFPNIYLICSFNLFSVFEGIMAEDYTISHAMDTASFQHW